MIDEDETIAIAQLVVSYYDNRSNTLDKQNVLWVRVHRADEMRRIECVNFV